MADFRLEVVKHQKLTRKISISRLDSPTPSLTLEIEKKNCFLLILDYLKTLSKTSLESANTIFDDTRNRQLSL